MAKPFDPTLNHEAVLLYREVFRLCPSRGRRNDIISTVKDLSLWKTILAEWKERKWNPLKIGWLLSEYERREKSGQRSTGTSERLNQRVREVEAVPIRIPERRQGQVPGMREGAGVRFQSNSETLEEVLTKALRKSN